MIKGKKEVLSRLMGVTGFHRVMKTAHSGHLTIFNYHRIKDDSPNFKTDFDDEVFGPSVSQLEEQLKWLKRNTTVISEDELLESLRKKTRLPKHATMVTFDDGYVDNFTHALPVLSALRIPAIFYIPAQVMNDRSLGWWDHISYLLKKTHKSEILLRGIRLRLSDCRERAGQPLFEVMKLQSFQETSSLVEELSQVCEVPIASHDICSSQLMTWDHLRSAIKQGITIGSHSNTHRVLATLPLATQLEELRSSKYTLENTLSISVKTLAYPIGGYEHFSIETMDMAKQLGYEAAFTFTNEINDLDAIHPFWIRRISPPENLLLFQGAISWPQVFIKRRTDLKEPQLSRQV
ncbi:MAG: polysaccharide deacetylase family protein [Bdellovibrionales bacterium]|nr:polysaccharide deacetylase family protein [Bdellovibrionales bacterium]